MLPLLETRQCLFSADRVYRYQLHIQWRDQPSLVVIGLNPSTADETQNDPTVRRCIGYARDMNRGGLLMLNMAAFRSTDPRGLLPLADPIGPENTAKNLLRWALAASPDIPAIAAWGTNAGRTTALHAQALAIQAVFPQLDCLRTSAAGYPVHPLYLPKSLRPVLYSSGNANQSLNLARASIRPQH